MATLEEVLGEVGEEKAAVIQAAIDAEKNRGIDASRKKGDEVKKWMTDANKLKDALRELDVDASADVSAQITVLKGKIEKAQANGDSASAVERKFQTQIDAITKKLADEEKAKLAAQEKYTHATLRQELSKAFGDSVYGVEDTIELMILKGKAKLTEDGRPVMIHDDAEVDLAAGVEAFKKANAARVKNSAHPGAGSSAGAGGSQGSKTITRAQFDTMSVKERAAYFAANPGAQVLA